MNENKDTIAGVLMLLIGSDFLFLSYFFKSLDLISIVSIGLMFVGMAFIMFGDEK